METAINISRHTSNKVQDHITYKLNIDPQTRTVKERTKGLHLQDPITSGPIHIKGLHLRVPIVNGHSLISARLRQEDPTTNGLNQTAAGPKVRETVQGDVTERPSTRKPRSRRSSPNRPAVIGPHSDKNKESHIQRNFRQWVFNETSSARNVWTF